MFDSGLIDNYVSGIRCLRPQGKGWVMLKAHLVPETYPLLPGHFHTHLRYREGLAGTHCPHAEAKSQ